MTRAQDPLVLLAGGARDPNLHALAAALGRRGVACRRLLVGRDDHPSIRWDLDDEALTIDGEPLAPTAVFLRHDVFEGLADPRPETAFRAAAWSTAIAGWALSRPDVRWFNRASEQRPTNKLHALRLARAAGLEVPSTTITNDLAALVAAAGPGVRELVAKPVAGGGPCRRVADLLPVTLTRLGRAAAPAIVQPELVPPERRLFGVRRDLTRPGQGPIDAFAFEVVSSALDYREDRGAQVLPRDPEPALVAGLHRLMDRMGLDFVAADFKADPASGRLLFLEINNGPMFAGFDRAADGAITTAMVAALAGHP
ncbi:MAG: hypothetical protein R3B09_07080 [Nannocystaceae bacterium]